MEEWINRKLGLTEYVGHSNEEIRPGRNRKVLTPVSAAISERLHFPKAPNTKSAAALEAIRDVTRRTRIVVNVVMLVTGGGGEFDQGYCRH